MRMCRVICIGCGDAFEIPEGMHICACLCLDCRMVKQLVDSAEPVQESPLVDLSKLTQTDLNYLRGRGTVRRGRWARLKAWLKGKLQ
jgi:hypothetical protein